MSTNKFLQEDVDVDRLAKLTKNYTGSEIAGIIKSASSFAMNRVVKISDVQR